MISGRTLLVVAVAATALSPLFALASPADALHTRAWVLDHFGPTSLAKCRAYKAVVRHTLAQQKAGGGALSPIQQQRLSNELATARAMAPRRLTAFDCGVPL